MNQLEEIQLRLNKISNKIDQIKSTKKIKSILTPQEIDILNIYFYNFQEYLRFKYDNLIYDLID